MSPKAPRSPEALFRALADQTRLRILNLIGDKEVCVCYFVETLRVPQPKISRHLAYLRKAGLVETRKQGIWVHYRRAPMANPVQTRIVQDAVSWISQTAIAQQDIKRFAAACCKPGRLLTVGGAPAPQMVCTSQ
jgi:ArsR family transcriptional regulator, arsenate/arsenite/antimonite-responsive transcriptional repressor